MTGMTMTLSAVQQSTDFYDTGIGHFLVSPGFGGLAALVGGLLAFLAAHVKARDDRARAAADLQVAKEQARRAREVARQERWWASLTWIYDRATAEPDRARLPPDLALDMFERLYEEAHTDLEVQAVGGLLAGLFRDETGAM